MNESLQSRLSEAVGSNNISYLLKDNKDFSVTGYKVMHNQTNTGLLRCAKIMYNGRIKLVYIVDGNKPLSYVAARMGVSEMNAVVFNLIQRAIDIRANGFFRAENLELDFNKIFVDMSDYSVHFVYFPLSGGSTGKISAFENEFRVALIKLFNSYPVFTAPQFKRLGNDLANGALQLDIILKRMQDNISGGGNDFDKRIYDTNGLNEILSPDAEPVNNVQNYGSGRQNYRGEQQGYGSDRQSYRGEQQGYGSDRQSYRGEQQGYGSDRQSYRGEQQGYGSDRQSYRGEQQGYGSDRQNYRGEQQGYGSDRQNYRGEQQGYGSDRQSYQQGGQQSYYRAQQKEQPELTVSAIDPSVSLVLSVKKPEYLIGKNPDVVDGAITYNSAISRVHCKINYTGGKYYITDMGSANGTYLNSQKLDKQQPVEIKNGDKIELANSSFIIAF